MIIFHLSVTDLHFVKYHLQTCHFVKHKPFPSKVHIRREDWLALIHLIGKDRKHHGDDLATTTSLSDTAKVCWKG